MFHEALSTVEVLSLYNVTSRDTLTQSYGNWDRPEEVNGRTLFRWYVVIKKEQL